MKLRVCTDSEQESATLGSRMTDIRCRESRTNSCSRVALQGKFEESPILFFVLRCKFTKFKKEKEPFVILFMIISDHV